MSSTKDSKVETIELQNGCVCCSLAEDLMSSVTQLISLAYTKNVKYDHIIIECSGIAEPRKIRELFQEAEDYNSPLVYNVKLDTLLTVVDAKLFYDTFGSNTNINSKSELAFRLEDIEGRKTLDGEAGARPITELLLEQVECADVILINKCDLLDSPSSVELVEKVIFKINPTAKVITCINGEVESATALLGYARGEGAASWGVLDEHRKMMEAIEKEIVKETSIKSEHGGEDCLKADCDDHSHSHHHEHHQEVHSVDAKSANSSSACDDPKCSDTSHDHSHSHSHDKVHSELPCDTTCNDPTHNHDHAHSHSHEKTTAEERFGITSLVFKRRKPFHPIRLSRFLQSLGKLSVKGITDVSTTASLMDASREPTNPSTIASDALNINRKSLLRSKGFVWMASSKSTVYFWSHAGQYVELLVLGRWWADIHERDWPSDMTDEIKVDFQGDEGDRRQELVFIGQFNDSGTNSKKALEEVLDSCLLTDEEMRIYKATALKGDEALRKTFFEETSKVRTDFDDYVDQLQKP